MSSLVASIGNGEQIRSQISQKSSASSTKHRQTTFQFCCSGTSTFACKIGTLMITNTVITATGERWKSALAATGLSWEDLGVTFESFYRLQNGEKKRSALDHICHTQHKIFDGFEKFGPRFSDHWSIKCNVKAPIRAKPSETFILRRSWKKFDQSSYLHDLVNRPWDQVLDPKKSVHEQAQAFQDIMKSTLDDHAWKVQNPSPFCEGPL